MIRIKGTFNRVIAGVLVISLTLTSNLMCLNTRATSTSQEEKDSSSENQITRSIDELGRIALPKGIRKDLGFNIEDEVKIFFMANSTILIKAQGKDFDYE